MVGPQQDLVGAESHADLARATWAPLSSPLEDPLVIGSGLPVAASTKIPHNIRMRLTGRIGLCPPPPAGGAGR